MGRAPCCDKASVKKGPWSPEEDAALKDYIEKHGTGGSWIALPQKAGLRRCGKSCRLRWLNYLRPNIKHGDFTDFEDRVICALYASIGSRWSVIAAQLPGRTDNDIKNYWNTKLKKKLMAVFSPFRSQTRRSTLIAPHPVSGFFLHSPLPHLSSHNQYHIPPPPLPPLVSPSYSLSPDDLQSPSTLEINFENPVQYYQVKEEGNIICGSSEASYSFVDQTASNDNYHCRGIEGKESLVPTSGGGGGSGSGGWTQEVVANRTWGDNAVAADYGFDEIKQLISPENSSCGFLFDENRVGESVYY